MANGEGEEPRSDENICSSNPHNTIFQTVIHLIDDNILHFHEDESEQGQRLYSGLRALRDGLLRVSDAGETVLKEVHKYDYSPEIPGNGFRSFTNMIQQAVLCVFEMCKKISTSRDSIILFRKTHYVKEVEAWGQTLASLSTILDYIVNVLLPNCGDGNLMPEMDCSTKELMALLNTVSQYSFYGRCLGFHYFESLQKTLKFLNISMCAFSEVYYSDGGFMQRTKQSLFTSGKYVMNPEQRARRIVDVVQYSSVDFIKAFWSLADTELLNQLPGIVGPTLSVHQSILVPCEEMEINSVDDRSVIIPAPQSHLPPCPIPCFLLSSLMRGGMPGESQYKKAVLPPSNEILMHCHGGGFVTQSTKAQEVFLREWASSLGVPIFSVDYSLAPEARYPRPLEEVLTAYVWMLKNFKLLGTTGKKVILTGDSAGGNLITALTLRCLELGIRPPDGLFLIYTPFNVKIQPTPARLLAVCDPMLPLGFALRCLKAYAGLPSNTTSTITSPNTSSISSSSNLESAPEQVEEVHPDPSAITPDPKPEPQPDPKPEAAISPPKGKGKRNKSKSPKKSPIKNDPKNNIKPPENKSKTETRNVPEANNKAEVPSDSESFVEVTENDVREAEAMVQSKSFASEAETDTMTTVSLTSDPTSVKGQPREVDKVNGSESKEERSKKYVSEFLEKYVLDSRVDKQGREVPILRTGSEDMEDENVVYETPATGYGIGARLGKARDAVLDGITAGWSSLTKKSGKVASSQAEMPSPSERISPTEVKVKRIPSLGRITLGTTKLRRDSSFSLLEQFVGVEVFNDHYISPLTAPTHLLAQFPPTSILTVEFDFCLDDCVTMARLLKSLNVPVKFDVLDKLPHGFLNLCLVSKEAHDGCKVSVARLRELLGINEDTKESGI